MEQAYGYYIGMKRILLLLSFSNVYLTRLAIKFWLPKFCLSKRLPKLIFRKVWMLKTDFLKIIKKIVGVQSWNFSIYHRGIQNFRLINFSGHSDKNYRNRIQNSMVILILVLKYLYFCNSWFFLSIMFTILRRKFNTKNLEERCLVIFC